MKKITRHDISMFVYKDAPIRSNIATNKGKEEIGWKVCINSLSQPVLVKLLIPEDANRTWYKNKKHEKYSKHRCARAKVLGFYSYYTGKEVTEQYKKDNLYVYSMLDNSFKYIPGNWVVPRWKKFMDNSIYYSLSLGVCNSGIHYFRTKESAYMWADLHVVSAFTFYCSPRHNAYRRVEEYL